MTAATLAYGVGLIGAAACIIAYLMLQMGRIDSRSLSYSIANAAGAAAIIVSLMYEFNMSAFVIEIFWLGISLYGIFAVLNRKPIEKQ